YKGSVENPFKETAKESLSTFAADVDTASYANIRRFLNEGSLPPPDAVRIEELVNYFDYAWKEPTAAAGAPPPPLAATIEVAPAPWAPERRLLAIGLRTRSVSAENLPPANLVFLVDSSGSMSSPDKLPLVQRAFSLLAEVMRPQDRVAIVAYAGSAGVVLPPTPGSEKARILESLERLSAGGSTAGGEGIVLAYETALANFRKGGNNRVILATDGDFNVGPSSEAELLALVEGYKKKGIFLSLMGFGRGNLKDSRMEALADKGNGNYAYVDSLAEARRVLVEEMGATLLTVAKDVKLQVEFDPKAVKSWRLVGYENRLLAAEDFADDTKDAGEMGAGHRVTALYEIEPSAQAGTAQGAGARSLGMLRVRYKKPAEDQSALLEFPLLDDGRGPAAASGDFRLAAAAAGYGLILRRSAYKGLADWPLVLGLAKEAAAAAPSDRRAEFVGLVEKASKLRP
ncbi:MAG: VWA domain-containing protein, partial [Spirochaetaceae bacterium]|nr:VWA domain-containing protein [Spirochaetaceae bacterium]